MFASTISAPAPRVSSGDSALTAACVPTGMNAGVRTSPCGVASTPARAAPSVAVTLKEITARPPAIFRRAALRVTISQTLQRMTAAPTPMVVHSIMLSPPPTPMPAAAPRATPMSIRRARVVRGRFIALFWTDGGEPQPKTAAIDSRTTSSGTSLRETALPIPSSSTQLMRLPATFLSRSIADRTAA